jgi:hypothetical protein
MRINGLAGLAGLAGFAAHTRACSCGLVVINQAVFFLRARVLYTLLTLLTMLMAAKSKG